MKLSVYHFTDLPRSYVVLQFEEGEEGRVLDALKSRSKEGARGLIDFITNVLGSEVRGVSIAFGTLNYRGHDLDMAYLRIELEDDREYVLEVYRDSAMINSNTGALEALEDIKKLMHALCPNLKEPRRPTLVGF